MELGVVGCLVILAKVIILKANSLPDVVVVLLEREGAKSLLL